MTARSVDGARPDPGAASSARALAARLAQLEVVVESACAAALRVRAIDYPGTWRPSGLLTIGGRGCVGRGEHVAFDDAEQERFAAEAPARLVGRRGTVGEIAAQWSTESETARWRRAAVEGALIDLALRQAGIGIADLIDHATEVDPANASLRYAVSFDACPEPAARIAELSEWSPWTRFKVDVDPDWTGAAIEALAATGRVAVLDFKGRGEAIVAERIAARFPDSIVEDPPAGAVISRGRMARDIPLVTLEEVKRAVAANDAINVKAPRLGGWLAALECTALALQGGVTVYWGGMFEVGVGRRQARALAALLVPEAESDLAPLRGVEQRPEGARLRVDLTREGFGR